MFRKVLLVALVSGMMVSGVQAAETLPKGYLFGNAGQADYDFDGLSRDRTGRWDDTDTAFKIGAGVQLSRHVSVELQYLDLGDAVYTAELKYGRDSLFGQSPYGPNILNVVSETDGFGANFVGTIPFERFKFFGKVGYHKLKTEVKLRHPYCLGAKDWCVSEKSTSEWVASYNIGASYVFTARIELLAEYERYQDVADEYDVDFASVGLRYNF